MVHAGKTRIQKRKRIEAPMITPNPIRTDRDGAQRCMTAVHATPHTPGEWANFQRLRPNNIPYETMQRLAANNFAPTSTRLSPALLGGYKNAWEAALYLSEKGCRKMAWPAVNDQLMYEIVMSSNYVTYIHRNEEGAIDAAAVLKIRSNQGEKYCWIEFIRALNPPLEEDEEPEADRPVPRFMEALSQKLGPSFDMLLLQVHRGNKHAVKRFKEKYGFVLDKEWDDKGAHLIGMSKSAEGEGLKIAAVRQEIEAKQREEATARRRKREKEEMKKLIEDGSKRPRRDSVRNVDYCFPKEFKIVAARDLLPNWAKAKANAKKSKQAIMQA